MNNNGNGNSISHDRSSEAYTRDFFRRWEDGSQRSAELIAPLVLTRYPAKSVVDVGCGVGTWAAAFEACGVDEVWGVDGHYVDREMLRIPKDRFIAADLTQPLAVTRRFDLAVCLEVAEHLPEAAACTLVDSLTRISNVVLFSAAVPGQGGTCHVNEQWPDYWAALFKQRGYRAVDCIRPRVWDVEGADWWYAQNTIVYESAAAVALGANADALRMSDDGPPMRLVHPRAFAEARSQLQGLRSLTWTPGVAWCARALASAVRKAIRTRASRLMNARD